MEDREHEKEDYRLNFFIHFLEVNDGAYILDNYNSKIVKIDGYLYRLLINHRFNDIPIPIFKKLLDEKIIVPENFNEVELYKNEIKNLINDWSRIAITIITTQNCNFRCEYCYEKDVLSNMYMKPDMRYPIYRFIDNFLKNKNTKKIGIIFLGGEPLLNFKFIKMFINDMPKLLKDISDFSIITNGYLLNKDISEFINSIPFKSIEVTLDGIPEIHNKRRPLANGKGTFGVIINNLSNLDLNKIKLTIRTNVDKENIDYYPKFLEYIEKNFSYLKEKAYFLIAPVMEINKNYEKNFYKKMLNMIELLVKKGFKLPRKYKFILTKHKVTCLSMIGKSFTIDVDEGVYKCPSGIDIDEFKIGYLKSFNLNKNYATLCIDKCKSCPIFGFCGGGCLYENYLATGKADCGGCPWYKYILQEVVEYAEKYKHEQDI